MAKPPSEPPAPTSTPQVQAAAVPQDQRLDPTPTLAQRLAAKFIAGNYEAMATLVSPSLLVTPAHVLSQSEILHPDEQTATIEFLGIPEQPQRAAVLEVDEDRDFAVLQLERPVSFEPPANLLRPVELVNTKWESYLQTPSQPSGILVEGITLGTVGQLGRVPRLRLQLEATTLVTNAAGASGAPVVAGESLIGILYGADEKGTWYAIPVNEMIKSEETDAVASLMRGDVRPQSRGRSPWITDEDFGRFSEEAINVLSDAREIGRGFNSSIIHTRHLVLAFLRQPLGLLGQLLTERNIDPLQLLTLKDSTLLVRSDFARLTKLPPISVNVRHALSIALQSAGADGPVEDRHILFGVLSTNRSPTVKALNEQGVTSALVRLQPASPDRESILAGYSSDDATGKDLLDITSEVEALASVLAATDVDPPLSLGLFGDWGTGKSFFMRKLEAEIKRLGEDAKKASQHNEKTAYCSNIVQITFNAWNYIDSDLWSSLTSEIFENLAAAIIKERGLEGVRKPGDAEDIAAQRELVLAAASSSEAILVEAERKKAAAEEALKQTEENLANLQKSETAIESALAPGEILKQALGFAMQDKDMKEYVGQITKTLRIPETKAAASEVQSEVLQLRNAWDTIVFTLKTERRLWMWLTALGLALVFGWGVTHFLTQLAPAANRILAGLVGVAALLTPFVKTISKAAAVVNAAKESKRELIEKKRAEQVAQLEKTRETVRQNVEVARKNVAEAHERVKKLNEQLDNMRANRRLADYIKERNESTDYMQHLGIISRVRTDLRHLSTLLREVKEEEAQDQDEFEKGMRKRQKEQDSDRKLFPQIDRIILYIDDLDRCPEKNVVEVLQAVHLLLAFPLFVVVVGVDPRWLLYSLQQSSPAFQSEKRDKDSDLMHDGHWRSTPLNYLEKIFQIPYSLRPIDERGFGHMVEEFAKAKSIWARHGASRASPSEAGSRGSEKADPASVNLGPAPIVAPAAPTTGPVGAVSPTAGVVATGGATTTPSGSAPGTGSSGHPEPSKSSAPAPHTVNRNPEHLQIGAAERAFMKQLHEFIPTPRSGKRFINIYRLLRASVTESERTDYQAAMLLLAILTGYPEQASEILRKLIEEKPRQEAEEKAQLSWWVFIDTLKKEMCPEAVGPSAQGTKKTLDRSAGLIAPVPSEREKSDWVELMKRLERFKAGFSDRPIKQFRKWAPRVARYSFQSGRVLYYRHN